ncbi:MAG: hypothetical protein BIFFINMI_02481 [Phycisphaerae bacterium]|nr:hypothetical protein [Phycisphaerae bacterium]
MSRLAYFIVTLVAAATFSPAVLLADGSATTQPDAQAAPPVTRPAAAPATQPDELHAHIRGMNRRQISDLLTRNLPDHLRRQAPVIAAQADEAEQIAIPPRVGILDDTQAELNRIIQAQKDFRDLKPEVQDRYREKAALIQQVYDSLSPSEKARLLSLTPEERAKVLREKIAELRAGKTRAHDGKTTTPPVSAGP